MDYSKISIEDLMFCFESFGYEFYCDGDNKKYHAVSGAI